MEKEPPVGSIFDKYLCLIQLQKEVCSIHWKYVFLLKNPSAWFGAVSSSVILRPFLEVQPIRLPLPHLTAKILWFEVLVR